MKRKLVSLLAIILAFCMFVFAACSVNSADLRGTGGDNPPSEETNPPIETPGFELPPLPDPEEQPVPPIENSSGEPAEETPHKNPSEEPSETGEVEETPAEAYYTPGLAFYFTSGYTAFEVSLGTANTEGGIVIPETYNGIPVTGIRNYAFDGSEGTFTVTLPSTIKYIGAAAFRNSGLASINMPASVCEIGVQSFYGCSSLTELEIPEGVVSIGEEAFSNCEALKILSVNGNNAIYKSAENCIIVKETNSLIVALSSSIPAGVESISSGLFKGDKTLKTIEIPASVKHIEDEAFAGCTELTTVKYAALNALESIGKNAFFGCTSLRKIEDQPGTIRSIGEAAFYGCTSLEKYTVGRSVTEVGNYAFWNCTKLKKLEMRATIDVLTANIIGDTVEDLSITNAKVIAQNAFRSYAALKTLSFTYDTDEYGNTSSRLERIDPAAFYGCANLVSINMELRENNPLQIIGEGAFANCASLQTFNAAFYNADSFKVIGRAAFQNCISLTTFEIYSAKEYTLDIIENGAFENCVSLRTVMIPNTKELGDKAYYGCGFEGLVIPKDLIIIGEDVFKGCRWLDSVSFAKGNMLDSIDGIFKDCTALRKLELPKEITVIKKNAFKTLVSLEYLYIESGSKLRVIEEYAFGYCVNLKEVSFTVGSEDSQLEIIEAHAFEGCANLKLFLPAVNLKYIGDYAFQDCRVLSGFHFGKNLNYIGKFAFKGCYNLGSSGTELVLPDSLDVVNAFSFADCRSLTSVKLPKNVRAIYNDAFSGCMGLTSVSKFPETLSMIGDRAFYGCNNMTLAGSKYFDVPERMLSSLGYNSFYGCYQINIRFTATAAIIENNLAFERDAFTSCGSLEITITPDVKSIPSYRFFGMNSLTKIIFAANTSIERIEHSAFYACQNLKEVYDEQYKSNYFPPSLEFIGEAAFGKTGFVNLYFRNTLYEMERRAFMDTRNLKTVTYEKNSILRSFEMSFFEHSEKLEKLNIPECVTYIREGYLAEYPAIKEVWISGKVVTLADYAFAGLKSLEYFEFGDYEGPNRERLSDLEHIGKHAFAGCENLQRSVSDTMLYIPASVKVIDDYAFYMCKSLLEVSFVTGSVLETIGNYAFRYCESIRSIRLGRTLELKTIGQYAFGECIEIRNYSFVIPASVTAIGSYAFNDWRYYQALSVDGGVTAPDKWDFRWNYNCDALIQYNNINYEVNV